MTDEQRKRIHDITYSTEDRMELAERIVKLEDERNLYSGLVEVVDHPDTADQLREENAKLREQMDLLVTLLRNDHDIDVSWDGLRKFWYIGLTKNGCLMRDRAYKAEAENDKLRELVRDMCDLLPHADWPSTECDEKASACIDQAIELEIEVDDG